MVKFCNWAFEVMQDGEQRTAKQLFELLIDTDKRKARYITSAITCHYALKADERFEIVEPSSRRGKGTVWKLA